MLDRVMELKRQTIICSVYEANYAEPHLRAIANTVLTIFNDVITREASARRISMIAYA
jgi:hypothetical protein